MHRSFGDALVIKVRDLLTQQMILQQRRSAKACLQAVLVIVDGQALVRCEGLIRTIRGVGRQVFLFHCTSGGGLFR